MGQVAVTVSSNLLTLSHLLIDCSAIIEHTNQVIYLEDNDVAAVNRNGKLTIHRVRNLSEAEPTSPMSREVITLKMELQQIMKGKPM